MFKLLEDAIALMGGENTYVKNVVDHIFVNMANKNIDARIAEGLQSVNMID